MTASASWRPVIAALANKDLQPVLGRMLLGDNLESALAGVAHSKRLRLVSALTRSGLITSEAIDAQLNRELFAELLAQAAEPKREGIHRFLDRGRIEQYPTSITERELLLTWVAERALDHDEVVDESTINARLEPFSDDTAALRRYLVDFGLIERSRDGAEYTRPRAADSTT